VIELIKSCIGIVREILYRDEDICKLTALIGDEAEACISYTKMTGEVEAGDRVLLNITAMELRLGSGGHHFVIANLSHPPVDHMEEGHIMKLRYTPLQMNCLAAEAPESPYHELFKDFKSLESLPVLAGSLHSVLAPCCIYLKKRKPDIKICYIMTDGGSLPIYLSDTVTALRKEGLLDAAVTYGNAFGGDYECINIYTALIAAQKIIKADIAIVCMGPGIAGTDTRYGFSGIEQGNLGDAVTKMGGYPVFIPRISFGDKRKRHWGISHHSITVLRDICCTKMNVVLPRLHAENHLSAINDQLEKEGLDSLHNIYYVDCDDVLPILKEHQDYLYRMGCGYDQDPVYFIACASAAKHGLEKVLHSGCADNGGSPA
jgi:hypothetical protein